MPWATKILRAACLRYSWNSSENWHDNFYVVIFCSPEVREFFNLDNPRNAETNDDDDQPGADESDTQVTNNVTLNLDVLQQAYYLHYLLFYYEQYHAPISIAAVPHLPACKVPQVTLPELAPLFAGADRWPITIGRGGEGRGGAYKQKFTV